MATTLDVWISRPGDACLVDDGPWAVTLYDCHSRLFSWAGVKYADMAAPEGHWAGKVPPGTYVVAARRLNDGRVQIDEAADSDHAIVVVGCESVLCVRLYVPLLSGTGTGTSTGTTGTETPTGTIGRRTGTGTTGTGTATGTGTGTGTGAATSRTNTATGTTGTATTSRTMRTGRLQTGTIQVDDPVIVAKGVEAEGNGCALVEIYCSTPGVEIRYTTDLRDPDTASNRYIHPIRFAIEGLPVVIKAKATARGYADSRVITTVIESW
jgi:hypothetical protein